jgi:hypothetical protein
MEKKTYYVTIDNGPQAGEIRERPDFDDPVYDYEIEATEEEINQLEKLFMELEESDWKTFKLAHIPYETQERMQESKNMDHKFASIYHYIYKLGTEMTKKRMKESGMII